MILCPEVFRLGYSQTIGLAPNVSREFVIVENIRLVCLLDLTADFEVKTNGKVDAELSASLSEQNWCVYSSPDSNFRVKGGGQKDVCLTPLRGGLQWVVIFELAS